MPLLRRLYARMNIIKAVIQKIRFRLTGRFLCDSCRYDYGSVCRRPERPNAVCCPDYRRR